MNIYNFAKSEIIKTIDNFNFRALDKFDVFEQACLDDIESQPYSIWNDDATNLFKQFFPFFYDHLAALVCEAGDYPDTPQVSLVVSSGLTDIAFNIIEKKAEAIRTTMKNGKLSPEAKRMQIIALIDVATQELEEFED